MAVDAKPASKRTLQQVFAEIGDRKILLLGPGPEKQQDSRFAVADAALDHVVIKLLGEDQLVLPYASITSIKLERAQLTIRVR